MWILLPKPHTINGPYASLQEILEVEQIMDEQTGLEPTAENVDTVLGEIRPYLIGTGGGGLEMVDMDGPIVKVRRRGVAPLFMYRTLCTGRKGLDAHHGTQDRLAMAMCRLLSFCKLIPGMWILI